MRRTALCLSLAVAAALSGCAGTAPRVEPLSPESLAIVETLGLDADQIAVLDAKPLYKFSEAELGPYLAYMQKVEPSLPDRIVRIGRKNIGQPYELYLLGEFPVETYDPQPLYCLDRSDCVVFSEHSYAMALSHDWTSFFTMLQRIRYKDGEIGVATRNHYTEADWNVNNAWLVRDISAELAGDDAKEFSGTFDRAKFLKNRYKIDRDIPKEKLTTSYVPLSALPRVELLLRNGDYVNVVVSSPKGGTYVPHVGLVAIGEDGTANFLHSTPPRVREEPIQAYVARRLEDKEKLEKEGKAVLVGFKFLRLEEDPIANLRKIDGAETPKVRFAAPQDAAGN